MNVSFLHKLPLRHICGCLLILAGIGLFTQLIRNEGRLIVFGQLGNGVIEKIAEESHSSYKSRRKSESNQSYSNRSSSSVSYRLYIRFTPEGSTTEVHFDTTATFGHDSKVGDIVRVVHLPDSPAKAEIYSPKQLWLPAVVGFIFSSACLGGGVLLRHTARPCENA